MSDEKKVCKNCEMIHRAHPGKFIGCAHVSLIIAREALGFIAQRFLDLSEEAQKNIDPDELENQYGPLMSKNLMETYAKMIPLIIRERDLPFDRLDLLEVFNKYVDETMTKLGYVSDDDYEEDYEDEIHFNGINSSGSREQN